MSGMNASMTRSQCCNTGCSNPSQTRRTSKPTHRRTVVASKLKIATRTRHNKESARARLSRTSTPCSHTSSYECHEFQINRTARCRLFDAVDVVANVFVNNEPRLALLLVEPLSNLHIDTHSLIVEPTESGTSGAFISFSIASLRLSKTASLGASSMRALSRSQFPIIAFIAMCASSAQ